MTAALPIILGPKLWTPSEISTYVWLDADDPTTVTLNGTTVSQLNDKSGNAINATQATASLQPVYQAIGLNGRGTIQFSADRLDLLSWTIAGSDWSLVMALKATEAAPNSNDAIFSSATTGSGTLQMGYVSPYIGVGGNNDSGGNVNIPAGGVWMNTYQTTTPIVGVFTTQTGSTKTYSDGTLNFDYAQSFRVATPSLRLGVNRGGTLYLNFDFGEFIAAKRVFSTDERQRLEGYLAWKWGTQSSLPATHPYKNGPPYV